MTSQWEKLSAILELSEKMPAKHKSAYLQSALTALAFECHAAHRPTGERKSMQSKLQGKTNGRKPRKKKKRHKSI